eukprot:scaffold39004_cov27-Phaeocystis_antarctica.AAC.1
MRAPASRPQSAPAPEAPARPPVSLAAAAAAPAERRYDTDDGLYTKAEFVGEYGGAAEWDAGQAAAGGGGGGRGRAPPERPAVRARSRARLRLREIAREGGHRVQPWHGVLGVVRAEICVARL